MYENTEEEIAMGGYPLGELILDLIQTAILAYLTIAMTQLASKREDILAYKLIAWAFGCFFMALVFWIPHYYIMQDWPQGIIAASDLGFIGFYCFFISAHFALSEKHSDEHKQAERRCRLVSLAAPVVTVLFFITYILQGDTVIGNILYAAPLAIWSYFTLRAFLAGKKSPARLYYGLVLVTILMEMFVFETSFFEDDTAYVVLSYAEMAVWLCIPSAVRKAV